MDDCRTFADDDPGDRDFPAADEPCMELPPTIGADERRMHVRAYERWLSLLRGRRLPHIDDLDPATLAAFDAHSVLIDFTRDRADPAIVHLGRALREEGGPGMEIATVADIPPHTPLARLADHCADIVENRAPAGFEAEMIGRRGRPILCRGILMPYSSDGTTIDLIHGVVNWKEGADAVLPPDIARALATALAATDGTAPGGSDRAE